MYMIQVVIGRPKIILQMSTFNFTRICLNYDKFRSYSRRNNRYFINAKNRYNYTVFAMEKIWIFHIGQPILKQFLQRHEKANFAGEKAQFAGEKAYFFLRRLVCVLLLFKSVSPET